MSTDGQIRGDSLRRQTAASELYASENGLELAPAIEDIGVSGFRGTNREFGKLANFLDQIERGIIESGSYLIVESLDRLSRQNVFQAFTLLGQIIQRGVRVVTLMDGQTYDERSLGDNQGQIFLALGSMLRAHEESRVKSKRVSAAWIQKRLNASSKKLTAVVPAWLELSADRQTIRILPSRGAIVREIFELARDGFGAYSIARRFNLRKEPMWSTRATLWHESYIKKILENRAVLGEYQPGALSYGSGTTAKRVKVGDPILGYYPAAIDQALFLAAQAAIDARRVGGRGRKGPRYSNLFTGIAKCGHCGYPMRVGHNSSDPSRAGFFLKCSSSRSKAGCTSPAWNYVRFEKAFIKFLRKVDLRYVLGGQKQDETIAKLEHRRLAIDSEISTISNSIQNLVDAIIQSPAIALSKRVTELEAGLAGLDAERLSILASLNEIEQSRSVMSKEELARLLDTMSAGKDGEADDRPRRLLASEINRVIRRIEIYSNGPLQPWEANNDQAAAHIESLTLRERKMLNSHFIVHYRTGESEYVHPYEGAVVLFSTNTAEKFAKRRGALTDE